MCKNRESTCSCTNHTHRVTSTLTVDMVLQSDQDIWYGVWLHSLFDFIVMVRAVQYHFKFAYHDTIVRVS